MPRPPRPSRRRFLKTAALAGAGAGAVGSTAGSAAQSTPQGTFNRTVDVAVIGAGFAGMVAAYRLAQAGRSVFVFDANDRVGGRSWSTTLSDGTAVDLGAGWTGSTELTILQLVKELGLSTYPQYGVADGQGRNLFIAADGRVRPYDGLFFPVSPAALEEVFGAIFAINVLASTVPLEAPWTAPDAEAWDSISAGVFARENVRDPEAFAVVMGNLTTIFGLNPFAVSFLHLLWESRSAGGVEKFGAVPGGSAELRIAGGTQQIPLAIARRLGPGALFLGSPVRQITQDDRGVTVASDAATVRARRAIVAIPMCLSGFIRYDPILPADRAQLIQRTPLGSAMKVQLVYDRAFWRDMGLSGNTFAIDGSAVPQTLDAGGPAGSNAPGILGCFIDDEKARDLGRLTRSERQARILQALIPRFTAKVLDLSSRITPNYLEFISQDQEWARGDYASTPGPGVLTASGFGPAIRAPFGRLHWAGVDTATIWYQSIEGAAQSGERAAKEVLAAGL